MTRTLDGPASGPTGWRMRAFVLGGLRLAALATPAALALETDAHVIGLVWAAAIAWTVLASLAGVLARGLRHRDWSAFARYELPDGRDEAFDMDTRTGSYAYLRDWEDRDLDAGLVRRLSAAVGRRVPRRAVELAGEPLTDERQVLRGVLVEGLPGLDRNARTALAGALLRHPGPDLAPGLTHRHVGLGLRALAQRGRLDLARDRRAGDVGPVPHPFG